MSVLYYIDVGYVYQDMTELGKEADETLDSTNDLDATLRGNLLIEF